MLSFVEVAMGAGEAVSCGRCGLRHEPGMAALEDVTAAVDAAVGSWAGPGGPNISFSGAEPFDHPGLPDAVAHAVRAGASRVRVVTGGAALAAGENARGCLGAGVRHARVVVLGTAGLHDALAGAPGLFDAAMRGMAAWVAASAPGSSPAFLSALVPVCEHNLRDLPSTVAELARAGAREVVLRVLASPLAADAAMWLTSACDTGTVNRVWVSVEGVPAESLGGFSAHAAGPESVRAG